ncbi:UDP-glucuronic acid decarboxylase family protein [Segatella buccae]|uniref:NAD dependent epimerase/dehydratase family protein n=1 Tax=Segatella buccae ATCC 33574 TaxID=873513 RepID=E6K9M5_9BACT|nr:UDP-glucuronic acid decarboxylase family protein [Segatella buccae]EFU29730.1 NAD dependent epimerase/dehydratase family protein [Segatella buccae ATCC 33574]
MERRFQEKVLVAGGAGFIGSHLCNRLVHDGYSVVCLDNLYTGSMSNIEKLMDSPRFDFIKHDVIFPYEINDISMVFNLACPASPVHYQRNGVYTTRTAVEGTINMLEIARKNKCRFLQASTSEVYGDPSVTPQSETYYGNVHTVGVRSCYDEGKRCAESLCMDYYREYGVKVKIIRIFNTYGPNMAVNDGRVMSNFIMQALTDKPLTIYGTGKQTRSFQYVDDLIEAMLRMSGTPDNVTGPVNIGNPDERTIEDIADCIKALTHSKSALAYAPRPVDDPCHRCPDISLAKNMLSGWEPKVGLHEGIQKTVEYFKHKAAQ